MQHQHTSRVSKWGMDEKYNSVPVEYDCKECGEVSDKPWVYEEISSDHLEHNSYVEGCFACKISTLELNTGDAGRADSMSQKKWDKELQSYRDARAQGIQPAGTSTQAIREAHQASETLGKAYNADVMPATSKITKQTAKSFTEVGVV